MEKRDPVRDYLAEIGSKGGKKRAALHSKAQLRAWAKLGGRPRKNATKKSTSGKERRTG